MNDININGKWICLPEVMRKLNFVEDKAFYTRKFTRVYVENNELFIGHTLHNYRLKNTKTKIEYENLNEWIKYFDRI